MKPDNLRSKLFKDYWSTSKTLRSILGIVAGIALTFFGFPAAQEYVIDPSWPQVPGVVVDTKALHGWRDASPSYFPVVGYVVGGKSYTVTGSTSSSSPSTLMGKERIISYDPASPSTARVVEKNSAPSWLPYAIPAIGLVLIGLGVAILASVLRRPKP